MDAELNERGVRNVSCKFNLAWTAKIFIKYMNNSI